MVRKVCKCLVLIYCLLAGFEVQAMDIQQKLIQAVKQGNYDRVIRLLAEGVDPHLAIEFDKPGLLYASKQNDLPMARIFLAAGSKPSPFYADDYRVDGTYPYTDNTPLYNAIEHGNTEMVRLLMQYGVRLNVRWQNETPLTHAARLRHKEILLLLNKNADVSLDFSDYQKQFIQAINLDDVKAMQEIYRKVGIFKRKRLLKSVNMMGEQPIIVAIEGERWNAFEQLLQWGADINTTDHRGRTPLAYAVNRNDIKRVVRIIDAGGDVSIVYGNRWANHETLLHAAVEEKQYDVLRILLAGCLPKQELEQLQALPKRKVCANTDIAPYRSDGPVLHLATEKQDEEAVRILLLAGANAKISFENRRALDIAVAKDNVDIVKRLVAAGDSLKQAYGETTLLRTAVYNGRLKMVKYLLESGLDVNSREYSSERPAALDAAVYEKRLDIIKILVAAGADLNAKDAKGETVLIDYAGYADVACLRLLVEAGADIHAVANNGDTALWNAAINGQTELVELLLTRGAKDKRLSPLILAVVRDYADDVNKALTNARTPHATEMVHDAYRIAVTNGRNKALQALRKAKTDINAIRKGDENLIWLALTAKRFDTLDILLQQGADPNLPGMHERFPLYKAVDEKYFAAVKLLVKHGANIITGDKYYRPLKRSYENEKNPEIFNFLLQHLLAKKVNKELATAIVTEIDTYPIVISYEAIRRADKNLFDVALMALDKTQIGKDGEYPGSYLYSFGTSMQKIWQDNNIEWTRYVLARHPQTAKYLQSRYTYEHIIRNNSPKILQAVIEAGLDLKGNVLEFAIKNEKEEHALLILSSGFKDFAHKGQGVNLVPESFLMMAGYEGQLRVIKKLIAMGEDVNWQNNRGYTALMECTNQPESLKLLLSAGANPNLENNQQRTALYYAAKYADSYLSLKYLIEAGANPLDDGIISDMQNNPFVHAILEHHKKTKKVMPINNRLFELASMVSRDKDNKLMQEIMQLSKQSKAFSITDSDAIHDAVLSGNLAAATRLLSLGVDVNKVNKDGDTPLTLAAFNGDIPMIGLLIKSGADLERYNDKERLNPLHYAVLMGHTGAVKKLLELKANINALAQSGFTPLMIAADYHNYYTLQVLLAAGADKTVVVKDEGDVNAIAQKTGGQSLALITGNKPLDVSEYMKFCQKHVAESTQDKAQDLDINVEDAVYLYADNNKDKDNATFYILTDSGHKVKGNLRNSRLQAKQVRFKKTFKVGIMFKSRPLWLSCSQENGCTPLEDKKQWPSEAELNLIN